FVADGDGDGRDVRARNLLKLASSEGDRLARRFAWIALAEVGARQGTGQRDSLGESRSYLLGLLARGSTTERPWLSLAISVGEHAAGETGRATPAVVHEAIEKAIVEHTSTGEARAHMLALAPSCAPSAGAALLARRAA